MEQFKRAKIIMLPTGESNLSINRSYKEREIGVEVDKPYLTYCKTFKYYSSVTNNSCNPQHLYIISDDEIKEGDWFIHYSHRITTLLKAIDVKDRIFDNQGTSCCKSYCKKIIATTDINLNLDIFDKKTCKGDKDCSKHCDCLVLKHKGLPQPSQQFIEKYIEEYNKGNIITNVLVEYDLQITHNGRIDNNTKMWEELKINTKDNTITIKKVKGNWNKEEVIELLTKLNHTLDIGSNKTFEEWIEENL